MAQSSILVEEVDTSSTREYPTQDKHAMDEAQVEAQFAAREQYV
jgi:hypothetical protein